MKLAEHGKGTKGPRSKTSWSRSRDGIQEENNAKEEGMKLGRLERRRIGTEKVKKGERV